MAVKGGGEVIISALNLYPTSVQTIAQARGSRDFADILSVYSQLVINESILTPFQTGEITLNDSNDMVPDYPIAGGNILHLKHNVQDGPPETEIDVWFRVVSIKNVVINERKQAYTLQLISEEGWQNMHTVLQSAFKGEPADIVAQIYTKYLKQSDKLLTADKTIGGLKFVCPMWKPSQAIAWVTNKTISPSEDMPGFFFYETMRGFRFLSTDTLLDKGKNLVITDVMADVMSERDNGGQITKGYLYKIPGIPVIGSDGKPRSGMVGSETSQNVDDFRILTRNPYGKDVIDGQLVSKHITHDIFFKQYQVEEYNYWDDFDKSKRIGSTPHYQKPTKPISSSVSVRVSPKHSRIHSNKAGDEGDRTLYADSYGLMRKHIMKQIMDEVIDNFSVPGTSIIEAGRLLEFNYPAVRKVETPNDVYQKKYSGLYLIRDVIHIFQPVANTTTAYKVDMNIVKDGWND